MATLRELKGRIGSVASSEKITGAMKMISSAKMHKAENSLRRLVPFKSQIQDIMANLLSSDATFASPLTLPRPEVKNYTLVAWGSDDGLCGAYNANIFKGLAARVNQVQQQYPLAEIKIVTIGKKLHKAAVKLLGSPRVNVVEASVDSKADGKPVDDFMLQLQQQFSTGKTDLVEALYMHFKTAGRQVLTKVQLLPVLSEMFETPGASSKPHGRPYLFEPDPNAIFNAILPMFLLSTMQEVFTENRASEQAARVMAMQSANDNAKTLLEELNLEYNKLRQQSITSELLDIVGGQSRE